MPSRADLSAMLAVTPYDAAPWTGDAPGGFRNAIEGFGAAAPMGHNLVHVWIGGG